MSWRYYNFACPCGHVYEDMVNGEHHRTDPCPKCAGTTAVKSLTAEICGDPAPGQSALDKKRAAQCSATSTQAGSATIARTFALSQSGNALTNA